MREETEEEEEEEALGYANEGGPLIASVLRFSSEIKGGCWHQVAVQKRHSGDTSEKRTAREGKERNGDR